MERSIDRTSYRRNARSDVKAEEVRGVKFNYISVFLNQIIVSLLIIIFILIANYFDFDVVTKWVKSNMSGGHTIAETFVILKNKIFKDDAIVVNDYNKLSGDVLNGSGEGLSASENGFYVSGDSTFISRETADGSELITAVEGVNQMSDDAEFVKENYEFTLPVNGVITSEFGCRVSDSDIVSSYHTGLDIAANSGTEILAAHEGTVTLAKMYSSYGNCVIIENGDLVTLYAHCLSLNVKEGQVVKKGEVIGKVGMTGNATGPHLHLEIRYQDRFIDPKDVLGVI